MEVCSLSVPLLLGPRPPPGVDHPRMGGWYSEVLQCVPARAPECTVKLCAKLLLALTLLVTQVVADNHDPTLAADHLALLADRLDARVDLHVDPIGVLSAMTDMVNPGQVRPGKIVGLLVSVNDAAAGEVVGGKLDDDAVLRKDTNVVLTHLSADVCQYLVSVLQLNAEHCIGQRLDHSAFDLDGPVFLRHILHDPGLAR